MCITKNISYKASCCSTNWVLTGSKLLRPVSCALPSIIVNDFGYKKETPAAFVDLSAACDTDVWIKGMEVKFYKLTPRLLFGDF